MSNLVGGKAAASRPTMLVLPAKSSADQYRRPLNFWCDKTRQHVLLALRLNHVLVVLPPLDFDVGGIATGSDGKSVLREMNAMLERVLMTERSSSLAENKDHARLEFVRITIMTSHPPNTHTSNNNTIFTATEAVTITLNDPTKENRPNSNIAQSFDTKSLIFYNQTHDYADCFAALDQSQTQTVLGGILRCLRYLQIVSNILRQDDDTNMDYLSRIFIGRTAHTSDSGTTSDTTDVIATTHEKLLMMTRRLSPHSFFLSHIQNEWSCANPDNASAFSAIVSRAPLVVLARQIYCRKWNLSSNPKIISRFVDIALGIALAIMLLNKPWSASVHEGTNQHKILQTIWQNQNQSMLLQCLKENISWLGEHPGGFKLNVLLTNNMGSQATNAIKLYEAVMAMSISSFGVLMDWVIISIALFATFGGISAVVAFAIDVQQAQQLHATCIFKCFKLLFRIEHQMMMSLLRLFRGKKFNALRHRTDSMKYNSTQLLLGTFCFCICLFSWTTFFVHYAFFAMFHLALQLNLLRYLAVYSFIREFPMSLFVMRAFRPDCFAKAVYIEQKTEHTTKRSAYSIIKVQHQSWMSVLLQTLKAPLGECIAWCKQALVGVLSPLQ